MTPSGGHGPLSRDIDRILIGERQIAERVRVLGEQIAADLTGSDGSLVIVAVLTGGLVFVADLVRALPMRLRIGIAAVSSYPGRATKSRGPELVGALPRDLAGRHVLLVDDILDTGRTLAMLRAEVSKQGPASVGTCVLVRKQKPEALAMPCEYVGFDIPDEFVVGYGLDYDDEYRNLPFIGTLRAEVRR